MAAVPGSADLIVVGRKDGVRVGDPCVVVAVAEGDVVHDHGAFGRHATAEENHLTAPCIRRLSTRILVK